jgi:opacity protein-like surface antigen
MKKLLITSISLIFYTTVLAQFGELLNYNSGGMVNVNWDISKPVGKTNDFIGNTSTSGISIDYRHCYKYNLIIGARTGWNRFYENKGLTNIENGLTSTYSRLEHKINAFPMLLVVDYMVDSDKFIPYAGIGIGGYFINSSVSSVSGTQNTNTFHFGISPELGITIPFIISNFGLNLSTRYNFALKTSKTDNFTWFDFNIGLSFMY